MKRVSMCESGQWFHAYTLVALPVDFKRFMVDIIDQFLLHVLGTIVLHRLVYGISKPLPRADRVDRAIAAFQVYAFVLVEGLGITVAVHVIVAFRVAVNEVASCSDHSWVYGLRFTEGRQWSWKERDAVQCCSKKSKSASTRQTRRTVESMEGKVRDLEAQMRNSVQERIINWGS
jgi:hypothetical protein